MKKLLYSILALAGVVATSCTQEHIDVTYDPSKVVAPVLNEVSGGDLQAGVDVTINYSEVNYNQPFGEAIYALYIDKAGANFANKVRVSGVDFTKATDGENGSKVVTIPAKTMNNILVKTLKAEYDVAIELEFQIEAAVKNEKGTAVNGTQAYSNAVKATFTPFEVKEAQPDVDEFGHVWVIGNYCGWDHAKTQFLYNYTGDENTYSGVIDFNSKAADGWKITGVAGWDDSCNWGDEEKATEADEPAEIQLINGGASQDIKHYAKRYYHFTFDKSSLVLTKTAGFDRLNIIGLGGWENDGVALEYNPTYCRFFADIDANAGDEFKVRADGAWTLNWGAEAAVNGDNFKVETAGKYRVYFNLNKNTLEINADMYGKDEPGMPAGSTTPEPEPTETTYGLIGDFNGWGDPDVDLVARGDGWYVTTALEVGADGKFLIRLNDAWTNKFGFAEADTFVTVDAKNALTAEGQDMWIAAGTYDFYFNPEASELYVMTAGATDPTLPSDAKAVKLYAHKEGAAWAEMALYGWDGYDFGGWPGILLTEKETIDGKEFFVYEFPVSAYGITTNIIFNNNNNGEQTQDITGVVLNRDYYYIIPAEAENGKFMAYEMGTEPVKPSFPVLTEHSWGVIGSFNNWGGDVAMEIVDGVATATIEIADTDGDKKFKVRADGDWANNFGYSATEEAPLAPVDGTEFAATFNGSDIVVEAAGKYEVALRIENEQGYLKITKL